MLHRNLLNYRDISLISFFNNSIIFFLINIYSDSSNVYSDSSQSALKYLKNTEANIHNILILTRDLNIRDSLWNSFYPHHSTLSNYLFEIADSFNLDILTPTNSVSTRYSDNNQDANSVLDLMFLQFRSDKSDNHSIHSDWRLTSDYASLTVTIPIIEEHIQMKKQTIVKDSNKERVFVKKLIEVFKDIDTSDLLDVEQLENIILSLVSLIERT